MPSLNQASFIGASIDSVLSQSYRRIELIVADGGSNDGTIAVLKQKAAEDSRLRWFSEPDNGPANALNKAVSRARGTMMGWLNSDDIYTEGAVFRAVTALEANPSWLMAYGHGQHIDAESRPLNNYPTLPPSWPISQFTQGCFICQPTVFSRWSMWVMLGKLDESLKTAFDFEYWLRAFLAFPDRIGFVDSVQAHSRLHEACLTMRLRRTVALEGMEVLARHLGSAPKEWLLTYVIELLAQPASRQDIGNLRQHVMDTLAVVRPLLKQEDLRELEFRLDELVK